MPRPPVPRFGSKQQQQQAQRSGGGGDASSASPPPAEKEREKTEESEMTLRAALPAEGGLDEEEMDTLREVEERLESNKVQLEYKDRKIDSIQQEVNAWAERRRRMKRRDATAGGGGKEGQGAAAGGKAHPEVGEAQMIEELESGVSDLKGAKGIIRVLFSSLVASRRSLKQKTGVSKGLQVRGGSLAGRERGGGGGAGGAVVRARFGAAFWGLWPHLYTTVFLLLCKTRTTRAL